MSSVPSHTHCAPLSYVPRPPGRLGHRAALFASANLAAFALDFVPEGQTLEQSEAYRRPVTGPRVSPEPGPGAVGW
jgi:hypothetical protein